jgi:hypothetical protein
MNAIARGVARLGSSPALTFLVLWAATAALGLAWAASTPMAASPDEPAHIIKAAAVVRGEWVGTPTERAGFTEVEVPSSVAAAWSWTCTAYEESVPASCQGSFRNGSELVAVETSAGLYNPAYYLLVGAPTLLTDDPRVAVYAMRALTAIICGFFLAAAAVTLLSMTRSVTALVAILAVLTPTTAFLAGSVNPNAVEVSTAAALLAALLALVRRPDGAIPVPQLVLVGASGVLLANTRGLSPLWMAAIAVIAIIAARPGRLIELLRSWRVWVTLIVLALGAGFAVLWLVLSDTLGNMGTFTGAGAVSPARAFTVMLLERSTDEGLVALFGWLDTRGPTIAYALWGFLALAVVFAALVAARGRLLWAALAAVAAFLVLPAAVQAASIGSSGYIWQGRYSLAIYAVVIITAAVAATANGPSEPAFSTLRGHLVIGLSVAAVSAFTVLWTIRRYALGGGGWWGDLIAQPRWLPPLGWWPWPLLAFLAVSAVVVAVVGVHRSRPGATSAA